MLCSTNASPAAPVSPAVRFPVLLEVSPDQGRPYGPEGPTSGHPTDVVLARYVMSADMKSDHLEPGPAVATGPADERDPAWMPDGRIAYISDQDGQYRLYVTAPGSGRARPLLDPAGIEEARFAPDGHEMAYLAAEPGGMSALWRARPDGSSPQRVDTDGLVPYDMDYTPDGHRLLFATWGDADHVGLYALDASGDKSSRLAAGSVFHPRVSPDGQTVAYLRAAPEGEQLWALDLPTNQEKPLTGPLPEFANDLAWAPDGSRLMLCAGSWTDPGDGTGERYVAHGYVVPAAGGDPAPIAGCAALRLEPRWPIMFDVAARKERAAASVLVGETIRESARLSTNQFKRSRGEDSGQPIREDSLRFADPPLSPTGSERQDALRQRPRLPLRTVDGLR